MEPPACFFQPLEQSLLELHIADRLWVLEAAPLQVLGHVRAVLREEGQENLVVVSNEDEGLHLGDGLLHRKLFLLLLSLALYQLAICFQNTSIQVLNGLLFGVCSSKVVEVGNGRRSSVVFGKDRIRVVESERSLFDLVDEKLDWILRSVLDQSL